MNILILINGAPGYKYFFDKLAEKFSDAGHEVFYAIDSHSSTFMEPVSRIDNSKKSFYFSDFFEKNYNTFFEPLYPCTYGEFFYSDFDRFLTHNYNLDKDKYYWHQARLCLDSFFKNIIESNNIDAILYENISNSFAYSAWRISQLLNIKYIGLMGARLPGHFEIQTSIIDDEIEKINSLAQTEVTVEQRNWFNEYRANISTIQPDYMKTNGLSNIGIHKLFKLKRFITLYRKLVSISNVNGFYEIQRGSWYKKFSYETIQTLKRAISYRVGRRYYSINDDIESFSDNEKFYVYPMHYHPESSTSVLASEYTDEYNNIINIANQLPFGTFLYVKDHESAKGIQRVDFYKKVSALPNVRLINHTYNIKKLMLKSLAVITINSTAAYEALLLDKPVFMFGRAFFENFPYVTKVRSFQDLKNKLSFPLPTVNADALAPWYVAYKKYTYEKPLLISNISTADDEYFNYMCSLIIRNVEGIY